MQNIQSKDKGGEEPLIAKAQLKGQPGDHVLYVNFASYIH